MVSSADIIQWRDNIVLLKRQTLTPVSQGVKRRRQTSNAPEDSHQPLYATPPSTKICMDSVHVYGHENESSSIAQENIGEETPRPQRKRGRPVDGRTLSSKRSNVSSIRGSPSQASGRSSPTKLEHLKALEIPIKAVALNWDNQAKLPRGLQEFLNKICDYVHGHGVLPASRRPDFESIPSLNQHYWYDHAQVRDLYGNTPSLQFVQDTVEESSRHLVDEEDESSWNNFVHAPVVKEAWRQSTSKESTSVRNIQNAAINPTWLLPGIHGSERAIIAHNCQVDFAICLEPDSRMEQAFQQLQSLTANPFEKSWNHSVKSTLLTRPITVSMETKKEGCDRLKAIHQLGRWSLAHLERLKQLAGGDVTRLPEFLPLLLVMGSRWELAIAIPEDGFRRMTLLECGAIGSTSTSIGVLTIIANLQVLFHWSGSIYLPWFQETVVRSILSDTSGIVTDRA